VNAKGKKNKVYWLRAKSRQAMEEWIGSIEITMGVDSSYRTRTNTYILASPVHTATLNSPQGLVQNSSKNSFHSNERIVRQDSLMSLSGTMTNVTNGTPRYSMRSNKFNSSHRVRPRKNSDRKSESGDGQGSDTSSKVGHNMSRLLSGGVRQEEDGEMVHYESIAAEGVAVDPTDEPNIKVASWQMSFTDLFYAIRTEDTKKAGKALEEGANVKVSLLPYKFPKSKRWPYHFTDTCQYKDTPLHVAARFRSEKMVKFLISKGAQTTALNDKGRSPVEVLEFPPAALNLGASREKLLEIMVPDFDIEADRKKREEAAERQRQAKIASENARASGRVHKRNASRVTSMTSIPTIKEEDKEYDSDFGEPVSKDGKRRDSFSETSDSDVAEMTGKKLRISSKSSKRSSIESRASHNPESRAATRDVRQARSVHNGVSAGEIKYTPPTPGSRVQGSNPALPVTSSREYTRADNVWNDSPLPESSLEGASKLQWTEPSIEEKKKYVYSGSKKEGTLMKRGEVNKAWRERYFILTESELRYYEKKPTMSTIESSLKGSISLMGLRISLSSEALEQSAHSVYMVDAPRSRSESHAVNPPHQSNKSMVKSLFQIKGGVDDPIFQFYALPQNSNRCYVMGANDVDIGEMWTKILGEQVANCEHKVVAQHTSTIEGYLHLLDTKTSSFSRYYFVLQGRSLTYYNELRAHLGSPLGGIRLDSGKSKVQQIPSDEYDRPNCFQVVGISISNGGSTLAFTVYADTEDEVDDWASAILRSC